MEILPEPAIISRRIGSVAIIISSREISRIPIPCSIAPPPGAEVYLHVYCLLPPIGCPVAVAEVIGPGGQASVDTRVPTTQIVSFLPDLHPPAQPIPKAG